MIHFGVSPFPSVFLVLGPARVRSFKRKALLCRLLSLCFKTLLREYLLRRALEVPEMGFPGRSPAVCRKAGSHSKFQLTWKSHTEVGLHEALFWVRLDYCKCSDTWVLGSISLLSP